MLIKPPVALLLLTVSLPLSLGAVTFTVTKETDDNGPCTLEDCALREAIIAANETPGRDLIVVPGGVYPLTVPDNADDALGGDLDIFEDVEIIGEGMATILGDGAAGSDGLFDIFLSEVSMTSLMLMNGSTVGLGGAIRVVQGRLDLVDTAIVGNRAIDGGGIFLDGSDATLINCLVEGNEASRNGGGIRRVGFIFAPADLTLVNTTVSGNSAATGGGIFSGGHGDLFLRNSTITNNEATVADGIFFFEAFGGQWSNSVIADDGCRFALSRVGTSTGGNIESPGETCFLQDPTDRMNVPDAGLAPLGHYGGPLLTHALLSGSPAIDTANDAECEATDQRGFSRPQDGDGDGVARCDVGAVEFDPRADSVLPTVIPTLDHIGLAAFSLFLLLAARRALHPRPLSGTAGGAAIR